MLCGWLRLLGWLPFGGHVCFLGGGSAIWKAPDSLPGVPGGLPLLRGG
jgi:hypothetical protein